MSEIINQSFLVLKNISELKTPLGSTPVKGAKMNDVKTLKNACVAIENGMITYVGENKEFAGAQVLDCTGKAVLPGFNDSHTHLVFGGYRAEEFMWRQQGMSYMDIMNRGGGIANSVAATVNASAEELYNLAAARLVDLAQMGITAVEIKSGYGLDKDTELKQLRVIDKLKKTSALDIASTYMGAHSIPKKTFKSSGDYIDFIINEMLSAVKKENLAEFVDIFCEKNVFSVEDSQRLFAKAKEMGFKLKIHADEIVCTFGAELAAKHGCVSADHLLQISKEGIRDLANSSTVATLLPLTAFSLKEPYAPARGLIDSNAAVALATDFNPGSCFSYSIPLLIAVAVIYMRMSINEVITALTINGACALGLGGKTGTIEVGKQADLVVLKFPSADFLAYHAGINCVEKTIKKGELLKKRD